MVSDISKFKKAKADLISALANDSKNIDEYWDELEVNWYALLDQFDQKELKQMGLSVDIS